jgi:hypothetical protein
MRLKNYTDISSDTIRAVISAVRPPGIAGFDVRVSSLKGRGCCGRAYAKGSGYHDRACPFVVVRVAKTDALVRYIVRAGEGVRKGKGYLDAEWGNRMEAIVFVLAHELRHLWQAKVKKGRRVWGARGQFSERDADAYALQMLRRFRRGELEGVKP